MIIILTAALEWSNNYHVDNLRLELSEQLKRGAVLSGFWEILSSGPMISEKPDNYSMLGLKDDVLILHKMGVLGTLVVAADDLLETHASPIIKITFEPNVVTWHYIKPDNLLHALESLWRPINLEED